MATTFTRRWAGELSFDYAGTCERPFAGASDGQWLRRLSLAVPLGRDGTPACVSRHLRPRWLREPGQLCMFAAQEFRNGNELFANYGTPAATSTLDRRIVNIRCASEAASERASNSRRPPWRPDPFPPFSFDRHERVLRRDGRAVRWLRKSPKRWRLPAQPVRSSRRHAARHLVARGLRRGRGTRRDDRSDPCRVLI